MQHFEWKRFRTPLCSSVVGHHTHSKVLALNPLDDEFTASVAIVGKELFLRGKKHLYCIAADTAQ